MKKLGIAVAVVAIAAFLYKLKYPTYAYRYRMTVEIDVGGEIRSGSNVIEVTVSRQPQFLPEVGPLSQSVRGEAVFVQTSDGRNVVALLASGADGENVDYPRQIVPRQLNLNLFDDRALADLPKLSGRWELASDRLPTLVTVSNPNDWKTARVISPDQLDQALGVRLRSITITMTTDSVTSGEIEVRLPFLVTQRADLSHLYSYPHVFSPHYSSFMR
jgi:hypothetical protein